MQNRKRDTDVQNKILDSVGEGEGGMFWENSIETYILSRVKQITSPGCMHEISAWGWCTGKIQRDGVGEGGGRGDRDGEYMISLFLNLTRLALWHSMWSILENVPCLLEKNVCSASLDGILFKCLLSLSGLICYLNPVFSYWLFCLNDLSIEEGAVINPPLLLCHSQFLFL